MPPLADLLANYALFLMAVFGHFEERPHCASDRTPGCPLTF